jgi:hypothetical protein
MAKVDTEAMRAALRAAYERADDALGKGDAYYRACELVQMTASVAWLVCSSELNAARNIIRCAVRGLDDAVEIAASAIAENVDDESEVG